MTDGVTAPMLESLKRLSHLSVLGWLLAGLFGSGCSDSPPDLLQGYIEGEYVYVASPAGGELMELGVRRGDSVMVGRTLFRLDPEPERAGVEAARARLAQAEAEWTDRSKGLRPTEIEALRAELLRLETERKLAALTLQRRESANLERVGAVSEEDLDRARAALAALDARVARGKADLETGQLGSREDAVRLAAELMEARRSELKQAEWLLAQKQQTATQEARVHDTLYRPGEYVPAGRPVVSLLPPENLKVRFFVPQTRLSEVKVGQSVEVSWDGANRPYSATIRYISTRAEYTPPVIYSRETRAKLVFLAEAFLDREEASLLKVGQPVDVRIQGL